MVEALKTIGVKRPSHVQVLRCAVLCSLCYTRLCCLANANTGMAVRSCWYDYSVLLVWAHARLNLIAAWLCVPRAPALLIHRSKLIHILNFVCAQAAALRAWKTADSLHIAIADQAGSGKTLAYLLPLVQVGCMAVIHLIVRMAFFGLFIMQCSIEAAGTNFIGLKV